MRCTEADHQRLREFLQELHAGGLVDVEIGDAVRIMSWARSQREWLGAGLIIGECACRSTLAIEKGMTSDVTIH